MRYLTAECNADRHLAADRNRKWITARRNRQPRAICVRCFPQASARNSNFL